MMSIIEKQKKMREGERDVSGWIKAKCDRNAVIAADDGEVTVCYQFPSWKDIIVDWVMKWKRQSECAHLLITFNVAM